MQQVVIQKRFRLATGVDTGARRSSLQCIDVQLEGWKLASRYKQESRATTYGEAFVSVHGHRRTEKGPNVIKMQQDVAQGSITAIQIPWRHIA